MNIKQIRKDFPILKRKIKGKKLIFLDNAATTQKPSQVINSIKNFYENNYSNIHRGIHTLSEEATNTYDKSHEKTAKFINSKFEETIFTSGTTHSINMLAYILRSQLKKNDEIILTEMEHHSNIVPWQQIAKELHLKLKFIPVKNKQLDLDVFSNIISKKTKIVSTIHTSNVLGISNNAKKIGKITHDHNALFILDAAQSIPHKNIDVKKLNVDFMAFSGHKMLAPTGIGVLYGKTNLLETLPPFLFGGDMIREVTLKKSTWNDLPWKYEAGTPNIIGGIGLGFAIDYLNKIGFDNIEAYEQKLSKKLYQELSNLEFIDLISPENAKSVFSFNIKGVHPHDVASLLDDDGIAVRGGHHCAMPLMKKLKITSSLRASTYIYNTKEEIDKLIISLKRINKLFKGVK